MTTKLKLVAMLGLFLTGLACVAAFLPQGAAAGPRPIQKVMPPHISTDKTVKYDYPIVCVRSPRNPKQENFEALSNTQQHGAHRGSELVLLHPDGREEVLVPVEPEEGITDPFVSFDGEWVYYAKHHHLGAWDGRSKVDVSKGSDIYKVHVPTRKVVQLTHQEFTPNTGAVDPNLTKEQREVYNLGPCPVPGGKVVFTSDRNGFWRASWPGGPDMRTTQLFLMNDDGTDVETIGHLNLGGALHPVILADGRIMFSSGETQGLRDGGLWGLWSIHPDGTNWGPLVSAFRGSTGGATWHFQAQLSDGHLVVETYYAATRTYGSYAKLPIHRRNYLAFGPANTHDPRSSHRVEDDGLIAQPLFVGAQLTATMPFKPAGMGTLTGFANFADASPGHDWGQVTHPSGAPDNHLLTAWGVAGMPYQSAICLIKSGKPINYPDEMLLIKSDPKYHYMWPRALVPYKRLYGIDEPPNLAAKKAKPSKHLPHGSPFGLVGTASLYKRESYPRGTVPPGKVTAVFPPQGDQPDPFRGLSGGNWTFQGAEAGIYGNEDVHAIRIVVTEPRTWSPDVHQGFIIQASGNKERLRILGEFPVRRFKNGVQPVDPDGNPDTSFLAKIPADMAWAFQTLDKHGMVLNMAQTWHQLRPGEVRHDCGGCHAHSQKPTDFKLTKAAREDYSIWDLTAGKVPLLTTKKHDESGQQWDTANESGVRWEKGGVKSVEFYRDVRPILNRSCVACHSGKGQKPAGELVLDADEPYSTDFPAPGTWVRLARDTGHSGYGQPHRFGRRAPNGYWDIPAEYGAQQVSRYVRVFQSRRSLLAWKIFGKRLDGFRDEDFITERVPGDNTTLQYRGRPVVVKDHHLYFKDDPQKETPPFSLTFSGSIMPPPEAVAGTYVGPDGKKIKVEPLSDEDRLTLVRWIDLGCPIDLTYDPANPDQPKGIGGFMVDDSRPTLALVSPQPGANEPLTRILVGMYDYYTGLDLKSFEVTADFPVNGTPAGRNLAPQFKPLPGWRWELKLDKPITQLAKGTLTIAVKDGQGNITQIERTFEVGRVSRAER